MKNSKMGDVKTGPVTPGKPKQKPKPTLPGRGKPGSVTIMPVPPKKKK